MSGLFTDMLHAVEQYVRVFQASAAQPQTLFSWSNWQHYSENLLILRREMRVQHH